MAGDSSSTKTHDPAPGTASSILVRAAAGLGAAALLAFALMRFPDPSGLEPAEYWWLMMVAPALALAGFSLRTSWQMAGIVAATFLIGFAAQLALRNPTWFQHFRLLPTGFSYLMTAMIGVQGIVAVLILLRNRVLGQIIGAISGLGWWRAGLALLVLAVAAKGAMDFIALNDAPRFVRHLVIGVLLIAINIASFLALVVALPGDGISGLGDRVRRVVSLPGSGSEGGRADRAFPAGGDRCRCGAKQRGSRAGIAAGSQ